MSKLFDKNDNMGNKQIAKDIKKDDNAKIIQEKKNEEELDKSFNKPIVSEKLHLKEVAKKMPIEDAMSSVNKKSFAIKIVGAVTVLVIIVFAGLIATDNLYRVTGSLPENPQKAVEIVLDNMQNVKSMHMEGTMTIDFNIASDIGKTLNNEKIKYGISGDTELPDKNHFIISVVSSSIPQISGAEIITIGDKVYTRRTGDISGSGNTGEEEWLDIDSITTGKAITPSFDTSMISNKYLKFIKDVSLAAKDAKNTHYKITMDGEKILASEDFKQLKKIYNDSISGFEITEDIWVDNKNKLISKNTADISMVTRGGGESGTSGESGSMKIKNSISLEFSDFGKILAIKAPENIKGSGLSVAGLGLSGNDEKRALDLVITANALQTYYKDNNKYPSTDAKMQKMNGENVLLKDLVTKYLPSLPADPKDPTAFYGYKSDGASYNLTAVFEDQNSSACTMSGNLCIFNIKDGQIVSRK